ncbi:MAG: T9SS type A sorting domain-containing protein, partial [Flavobacteriales bacterium]|nr:T9SS type A sorting domain-containing protein [Flavobacteriales bacterium]
NSTSDSESIGSCDSYTWLATSVTYNTSGTYTALLTNAVNCDSLATLNLTITNGTSGSEDISSCDSYTWLATSVTYNTSGIYTALLTNAANCDSTATLNLTINSVETSVTLSVNTLTSNVNNASYQWVDCGNGNAPIVGETGSSFTSTNNGNFAVEVTQNGCIDTSACYSITSIGIIENDFGNVLQLYPNPTGGLFTIDLGSKYESVTVRINDLNGKLIRSDLFIDQQLLAMKIEEPNGVYFLVIESQEKKAVIRIVKE